MLYSGPTMVSARYLVVIKFSWNWLMSFWTPVLRKSPMKLAFSVCACVLWLIFLGIGWSDFCDFFHEVRDP